MTPRRLPRLYAILDGGAVRAAGLDLLQVASSLRKAGLKLLQYRDKQEAQAEILKNARAIGTLFQESGAILILNDWPEIAVEAGWHGVHVGQTDTAVAEARSIVGRDRILGVSTHTVAQFRTATATDADYLAYGPIFETATKLDAELPVGLTALQQVRPLTARPIVAIGGISSENMSHVFAAGADSVAVIGALFKPGESVVENASQLLKQASPDR